jgi:hypothetical protein
MHASYLPGVLSLTLAAALGLSAAPAHADETRSRWIAAIPFGAGQFQNGDVALGITFAAGEAILASGSIATAVLVEQLGSTNIAARTRAPVDIGALNDRIADTTTANRVLFAAWAGLAVAGVIEAQVSFVRPRPAGERAGSSVMATAAPLPGGALLGVRAAF